MFRALREELVVNVEIKGPSVIPRASRGRKGEGLLMRGPKGTKVQRILRQRKHKAVTRQDVFTAMSLLKLFSPNQ